LQLYVENILEQLRHRRLLVELFNRSQESSQLGEVSFQLLNSCTFDLESFGNLEVVLLNFMNDGIELLYLLNLLLLFLEYIFKLLLPELERVLRLHANMLLHLLVQVLALELLRKGHPPAPMAVELVSEGDFVHTMRSLSRWHPFLFLRGWTLFLRVVR